MGVNGDRLGTITVAFTVAVVKPPFRATGQGLAYPQDPVYPPTENISFHSRRHELDKLIATSAANDLDDVINEQSPVEKRRGNTTNFSCRLIFSNHFPTCSHTPFIITRYGTVLKLLC